MKLGWFELGVFLSYREIRISTMERATDDVICLFIFCLTQISPGI